jgi:hypothetical protein
MLKKVTYFIQIFTYMVVETTNHRTVTEQIQYDSFQMN